MKKKNNILNPNHFRVAIFGSARIKKNDPIYKDIIELSKLIANQEIDIITGGGPGLMHAANHGHRLGNKKKSSHSIGLNIKLPYEQDSNRHLDIKKDFNIFSHRLDDFMRLSNIILVTPGGIGTALELFYAWQLTQVKHICNRPIILYGKMWEDLIKWIKKWPLKNNLMSKKDLKNIFIVKNKEEAFEIIKKSHKQFANKKKSPCKNIKEYRAI